MASKPRKRWPLDVFLVAAVAWAGVASRLVAADPPFVIDLPGGGQLPG